MLLVIFECSHFSEDSTHVTCAFFHLLPSARMSFHHTMCQSGPYLFFKIQTLGLQIFLHPASSSPFQLNIVYFVVYSFVQGVNCLLTYLNPVTTSCGLLSLWKWGTQLSSLISLTLEPMPFFSLNTMGLMSPLFDFHFVP